MTPSKFYSASAFDTETNIETYSVSSTWEIPRVKSSDSQIANAVGTGTHLITGNHKGI